MLLFFRPQLAKEARLPDRLTLDVDESRHLSARRLAAGAQIAIGDGVARRGLYLLGNDRRSLSLIDGSQSVRIERGPTLVTAIPEGKRWEWLLQKATELGVSAILPLEFERSVRLRAEPGRQRRLREERIIAEAAAQSQRYSLPLLEEVLSLADLGDWLWQRSDLGGLSQKRLVLDPRADTSAAALRAELAAAITVPAAAGCELFFVVGPEGGLSERELDSLTGELSFCCLRLGETILRVETAAIAALVYAQTLT